MFYCDVVLDRADRHYTSQVELRVFTLVQILKIPVFSGLIKLNWNIAKTEYFSGTAFIEESAFI